MFVVFMLNFAEKNINRFKKNQYFNLYEGSRRDLLFFLSYDL